MHGYCNCKRCNEEYTSRNYYHVGDDDPSPRRSKKPKAKPKRRAGCPENNDGRHIYVWVEYHAKFISVFSKKWVEMTYWTNECVGCKHRSTKYAHVRPANVYAVVETDLPRWYY